jgi:hypothetical protein
VSAIVAGPADLRRRSEQRPRFTDVAVALAEVDTVRAEPLGQRHAVVDDERDVRVGTDALERVGEPRQLILADLLHAELEGGRDPRFERGPKTVWKYTPDLLRADQVKSRRFRPPARRKLDWIELSFVQGQAGIRVTDAS